MNCFNCITVKLLYRLRCVNRIVSIKEELLLLHVCDAHKHNMFFSPSDSTTLTGFSLTTLCDNKDHPEFNDMFIANKGPFQHFSPLIWFSVVCFLFNDLLCGNKDH